MGCHSASSKRNSEKIYFFGVRILPSLNENKQNYLEHLHRLTAPISDRIASETSTHQQKAKAVNAAINEIAAPLLEATNFLQDRTERQSALIVLQYCISVVSLEYRHKVWPYEYMAFSRRNGELWERFCSASWDCPSRTGVARIEVPKFRSIASSIRNRGA